MKKLFPLFILVFVSIYTFAQTVTNDQVTMITKRTADWCPNCGTYGWTFTKNLNAKLGNRKAIVWNAHHSGGLMTPTSSAFVKNLGGSGQPIFFVNSDEDLNVSSGNVNTKVDEAIGIIDDLALLGSFVGMGSEAKLSGNKLTVNTKVKFLSEADNGEYFVATYIVKKNLVWTQANQGSNAVHHAVLDKSLTTDPFGSKITKAPVAANAEFTTSAELENLVLHNGKLEDTKIVTILWNKLPSGKYVYINGREVAIANTSDVAENKIEALDFDAVNVGNNIKVKVKGGSEKSMINMYDINGKEVLFTIGKSDENTYLLENINAVPGFLLINVTDKNQSKSKQIFYRN